MRIKSIVLSLSAVAAFATGTAEAATNLVTNGNFEQVTNGTNKQLASSLTSAADRTTLTGWTSSNGNDGGYNFVLNSAIANTWDSAIWLKGNGNGYSASANGGNFFASDSQYWPGVLSQTVSGLTVGSTYTLTFQYALAQQTGFDGANTANFWEVGFGGATKDTTALSIASGGFSGWQTSSMTFTANSGSEVLSFLAKGSPGAPPFLLLDGVSLTAAVPEPATWGMLLGGLGLVGYAARRRAAKRA
ncbi:PEPxxWA-CTERM sorting domain-containing protein [Duganella callida]|uniref:PEP-CTERM sorting domain-containing protein n=1 Tax=Duganella callida TaxID=2561932 RepID=A0A4Y9RVY4_9BURK|nr:PEPxxWA-CTERM sorting domain-containing protein [Duganella callida]TFW13457.1 PEP-CTERM sorting domain-containing protein [Duganella callida]